MGLKHQKRERVFFKKLITFTLETKVTNSSSLFSVINARFTVIGTRLDLTNCG